MLQNILNLGVTLQKEDQKSIQGGAPFLCSVCFDYCRAQNFQTKPEFSACFYDCKEEHC